MCCSLVTQSFFLNLKGLSHTGDLGRSSLHDYGVLENVQNVSGTPRNLRFYTHKIHIQELCATARHSAHEHGGLWWILTRWTSNTLTSSARQRSASYDNKVPGTLPSRSMRLPQDVNTFPVRWTCIWENPINSWHQLSSSQWIQSTWSQHHHGQTMKGTWKRNQKDKRQPSKGQQWWEINHTPPADDIISQPQEPAEKEEECQQHKKRQKVVKARSHLRD